MKNANEIQKLCYVKLTLEMMSAGLKISKVKVKDLAESIGAPKTRWTSKKLAEWIDDKMMIMSLS